VFVPEALKKQNELIGTLRKQLEATERELAGQKWLLNQYLQSPSWKVTAPLRWTIRRFRAMKQWVTRQPQHGSPSEIIPPPFEARRFDSEDPASNDADSAYADLKQLYTSLDRISLEAFLASKAVLELPAADAPEISIVLVLFNRAELTLQCLRSIRENLELPIEVIIVDNASTDSTSVLLARTRGARIMRNSENRHFLRAVNQGAAEARGKYVLLLNNDARLLPGSLSAALETITMDENIGAVGGRIILLDGRLQEAGSIVWRDGSCLGYGRGDDPFAPTYMFRRDVDYCSGAFLLTPRVRWKSLGGFDDVYEPAYYEETDYCMRLWERNLRVVYDPFAVVLHHEFASSVSMSHAIELQRERQAIFATRHAAALQQHCETSPDAVLVARTHRRSPEVPRILVIDDRVPDRKLGSGFPRARTILLSLLKRGFFVTLFPMAVFGDDWADVYTCLPRDVEVIIDMGPSLLEAFLRHRQGYYDAVIVSRPQNMRFFNSIASIHADWFENTPIIYDAEGFLAPREVGMLQLSASAVSSQEADRLHEVEASLASRADCVVAVSELDRTLFEKYGVRNVHVLGHTLDPQPTPSPFEQRRGFLFIGAIHEDPSPNGDSVMWFVSEVWPAIRERLGDCATLTVVGLNKSQRLRSIAAPGVEFTGAVDDVSEYYDRARVFVAPTRFAAGIPHKVHEAASRGVPAVVTPLLARQLAWNDGRQVAVGGTSREFAERCIQLHETPDTWMRLREAALDAVRRECATGLFEERMSTILASAKIDPLPAKAAGMTRSCRN